MDLSEGLIIVHDFAGKIRDSGLENKDQRPHIQSTTRIRHHNTPIEDAATSLGYTCSVQAQPVCLLVISTGTLSPCPHLLGFPVPFLLL